MDGGGGAFTPPTSRRGIVLAWGMKRLVLAVKVEDWTGVEWGEMGDERGAKDVIPKGSVDVGVVEEERLRRSGVGCCWALAPLIWSWYRCIHRNWGTMPCFTFSRQAIV